MKLYTFKTNIKSKKRARIIQNLLPHYFNIAQIKFEYLDMNSILTIKAKDISPEMIQATIREFGYRCKLVKA